MTVQMQNASTGQVRVLDDQLRLAPWDDPSWEAWDAGTIIESQEKYQEYLNSLQIESCYACVTV
jgi:hypothetical protein